MNYREALGFRVLPLTGGPPTFRQLKETVENGGIVCLMGDRYLKQTGVSCEMLGEATSLPTGSVQLALRFGAVGAEDWCGAARGALLVPRAGRLGPEHF